jgi:hypothetical protein
MLLIGVAAVAAPLVTAATASPSGEPSDASGLGNQPKVLFTSGFESADAGSEWYPGGDGGNQTGGGFVTRERARTGEFSWKAYNDPRLPSPDNISAKLLRWRLDFRQAYYTAWFYWPPDYTVAGHGAGYANIFQWKQRRPSPGGSYDPTWVVAVMGSQQFPGEDELVVHDWHNEKVIRTGASVPKGRWAQLQAFMRAGRFDGAVTVYLDGRQIFSATHVNTLGTPADRSIPYTMWGIGNYSDAGIGKAVYFDDVTVTDGFLPPTR